MKLSIVKLGDILEVQNGFAFKSEFFSDSSEGIPLIRIRDLKNAATEVRYIGEYKPEFIVQLGDYLVGMDGDFECYRWQGESALLNQRVCRLRNFSPSVEPEYIYYGIQEKLADIHRNTSYVTVKHLSSKQISNIELPLPSSAEQRHIVDILKRADGIRHLRKQAIQTARELIPALFVDMFGDPATNPKKWPEHAIGNLCGLVRGSSPRPQGDSRYFGGPIPRLMIADITRDGIFVTPRIDSLTIEGAKKSRPMKAGDVVMAVSGAVGLPAILSVDACIHDGFVGFRELRTDLITTSYLFSFLQSLRYRAAHEAVGAIFQNLTTDQINRWSVPVPPPHLQDEFIRQAEQVRAIEQQQDDAAQKTESAFTALLHLAFRGEL